MAVRTVPPYQPANPRNKTRDARRAVHTLDFVGVDGEGVDDEYVMLSVGDETLHNGGRRLTHADIFPFLWDHFLRHPQTVYVGFALTYDFTMWLRYVSKQDAYALFDKAGIAARTPRNKNMVQPFPVRHPNGEWEFDLMGNGKRFRLRPNARRYGTNNPWLYISDVFGYWQTSFVRAIDPAKWVDPICTPEEYDVIMKGKRRRSVARFNEEMQVYNVTENRVLARAMAALNKGLVDAANVRLRRAEWFGPGQAAQKWLINVEAPTRMAMIEATPGEVRERSIEAYYGGWFENLKHGIQPGVSWSYDIISAYPAIIADLPCMLHGEWRQLKRLPGPDTLALIRANFTGIQGAATGPLPFRTKDGAIMRPRRLTGTYWWHEIQAAVRAGLMPRMSKPTQIEDIWAYYPRCKHPPPLRGIRDLYEQRLAVDKASPQGKALKVIMNSTYGKTAQTVGNPRFSNMVYAGMITSLCRTQILDAIATHPGGAESVLMVNTDGITFDSRHPNLTLSDHELGLWEEAKQDDLCLFMPGVYWSTHDVAAKIKRRGMPTATASLVKREATQLFEEWAHGTPWPAVTVQIPWQFVTAKLAYSRGKWETAGRSQYNRERRFNSNPHTKRQPAHNDDQYTALTSTPYPHGPDTLISTPYKRAENVFGWIEELEDMEHQDEEWRADLIDELKGDGII